VEAYRVAALISPDSETGNLGAASLPSARTAPFCVSSILFSIDTIVVVRMVGTSALSAPSGIRIVGRSFWQAVEVTGNRTKPAA
jgi:hypothetical protein